MPREAPHFGAECPAASLRSLVQVHCGRANPSLRSLETQARFGVIASHRLERCSGADVNCPGHCGLDLAHFFPWFDAAADLQEPGALVARASRQRGTAVLIDPFDPPRRGPAPLPSRLDRLRRAVAERVLAASTFRTARRSFLPSVTTQAGRSRPPTNSPLRLLWTRCPRAEES